MLKLYEINKSIFLNMDIVERYKQPRCLLQPKSYHLQNIVSDMAGTCI